MFRFAYKLNTTLATELNPIPSSAFGLGFLIAFFLHQLISHLFYHGDGLPVAHAIVFVLFVPLALGSTVGFYLFALYYQFKVKLDYGPRTLTYLQTFFVQQKEGRFDLDTFALSVGESKSTY